MHIHKHKDLLLHTYSLIEVHLVTNTLKIKPFNSFPNTNTLKHTWILYSHTKVHKMNIWQESAKIVMHSQLLKGFNCEPKYNITKEGGVGACSLAHNTLRGRGACWSSGMGLGRVDKLHSLTRACTQPTQSG